MFIHEHEKLFHGFRNSKKELTLEDLALKRALFSWKEQSFLRPVRQRPFTSRESTILLTEERDFLKGLKTETPDVEYGQFPSPEFKPGRFFYFPSGTSTRNYHERKNVQKFGQTASIVSPGNQLCQKMRRKIFCEVLQEDKLCLDCNSRIVRGDFNHDMNREFPYLEYDRVKRPYGFCPRAIRLTEPLPSRGSKISWHGNCDCTGTKSAMLLDLKKNSKTGWVEGIRPFTT